MRKSDKKIDNQLRAGLTDVCETALKQLDGFVWLTHLTDYSRFPQSLKVVCVFDTKEHLRSYEKSEHAQVLVSLIEMELQRMNLVGKGKLKSMTQHLVYDTEEACKAEHGGNWAKRLG